ncbi:DMT family transporter [Frigidibacter sp. MR17.24]|uniref:DMT family transporter n=1 Tax=Frigidibacter sp. MR17.24 TaxID=3127345 RepID=UPI003012D225
MTPTARAVALMVAAAVLAGCDAVIVRLLAGEVHPLVIGFFRAAFGLVVVVPMLGRGVDLRGSPYRWMHVLRAGLKLASLVALFLAFAHAPLADAMAVTFTTPILVTLGAGLWLGERIGPARAAAAAVGFGGILVILRPGAAAFDPWLVAALAGAVLTAVIQLILRAMSRRDRADRLVAWNLISMVPLAALAAWPVWEWPGWTALGLLAAQGLIGALNMTAVTRAVGLAEISLLAPLDFLRLPAVALLAMLVFGQYPPATTWIGAAVICGAAMLTLRRRAP